MWKALKTSQLSLCSFHDCLALCPIIFRYRKRHMGELKRSPDFENLCWVFVHVTLSTTDSRMSLLSPRSQTVQGFCQMTGAWKPARSVTCPEMPSADCCTETAEESCALASPEVTLKLNSEPYTPINVILTSENSCCFRMKRVEQNTVDSSCFIPYKTYICFKKSFY